MFTDEFGRAVKICTGAPLNEHLIDTVFAIFDEDGDGENKAGPSLFTIFDLNSFPLFRALEL